MPVSINTDFYTVFTQKNSYTTAAALSKSIKQLSSGLRINTAADDASGIAIADKLHAQALGLSKVFHSVQDSMSFLQSAEGGLSTIHDMLQRMRELAVSAGNSVRSPSDLLQLQKEYDQLKTEIDKVALSAEFNTRKLLSSDAVGSWSASSQNVSVIFRGIPDEGSYRLTLEAAPGNNAIYQSHILYNDMEKAPRYADLNYKSRTIGVVGHPYSPAIPGKTYDNVSSVPEVTIVDANTSDNENYTTSLGNKYGEDVGISITATKKLSANDIKQTLLNAGYKEIIPNVLVRGYYTNASSTIEPLPPSLELDASDVIIGAGSANVSAALGVQDIGADSVSYTWRSTDSGDGYNAPAGTASNLSLGGVTIVSSYLQELVAVRGSTAAGVAFDFLDLRNYDPSNGVLVKFEETLTETVSQKEMMPRYTLSKMDGSGNFYARRVDLLLAQNKGKGNKVLDYVLNTSSNSATFETNYDLPRPVIYAQDPKSATVQEPTNRTDLANIYELGAENAGIIKLKANGDAEVLYESLLTFSTAPVANGKSLIDRYSAQGDSAANYINRTNVDSMLTLTANTNNSNGYLEVEFTADTDASANGNMARAKFTFVDAKTGERRTIDSITDLGTYGGNMGTVLNDNFRVGTTYTLDFQNGVKFNVNIPRDTVSSAINAGDKLLLAVNSASSNPDDSYATVNSRLSVAIDKNAGDKIITVVGIKGGKFAEANLAWTQEGAIVYDTPVTLKEFTATLPDIHMSELSTLDGLGTRNLFDNGQFLTIYGNNSQTEIFIEGRDTLSEFAEKLATAISKDLGMSQTGMRLSDIVHLVTKPKDGTDGLMSTLTIQSALTGRNSELTFAGSEGLLNTLGIRQIQEARDSTLEVGVYDLNSGAKIGSDEIGDHVLRNVIKGVDVRFINDLGINASFSEKDLKMVFGTEGIPDIYLHISDSKMSTIAGANEHQLIQVMLNQTDTVSLELDNTNIVSLDNAGRALTKLDLALESIGRARATLGAQIKRFESTHNALSIVHRNMIEAESRIRDLDVAEESAVFTKNQMLKNAEISMLKQSEYLSQTALSLING